MVKKCRHINSHLKVFFWYSIHTGDFLGVTYFKNAANMLFWEMCPLLQKKVQHDAAVFLRGFLANIHEHSWEPKSVKSKWLLLRFWQFIFSWEIFFGACKSFTKFVTSKLISQLQYTERCIKKTLLTIKKGATEAIFFQVLDRNTALENPNAEF